MIIIFILLAFATCTVWIKELKISIWSIPLWVVFLIAALVSSVINHYVEWIGVFEIAIFGLLSYLTKYSARYRLVYVLHLIVIGLMALLIAMGKFPGFHNPNIVTDMRFNADGLPFTHRLRIDGISVGIILLAVFCSPARTWNDWSTILRKSPPIMLATVIVILGCALLLNFVAVDVKLIPYTFVFLIANLLFTCVMEESFFRGFLQENVTRLLANWKYGAPLAIVIAALLFGFAHFNGGLMYIALATLAGLFYGYAKFRVQHIEAAILTHFSVNAVHFIAFTYPNF
jgi:membrane protease YdiL (CAAX protease family)